MAPVVDALRTQVQELQAVSATYPEPGELCFMQTELAALQRAEQIAASEDSTAAELLQQPLPQLSGMLVFREVIVNDRPVSMRFTLPALYPREAPRLQIDCACDRVHHDELTALLQQVVAEPQESGYLLSAADALQQRVVDMLEQGVMHSGGGAHGSFDSGSAASESIELCRCVIWFHHIKSFTKRKHIVQWANDLHLRGYSKPGFPGVIVVEGQSADVEDYIQRLRALKWQAMAVRGEDRQTVSLDSIDAAWRFKAGNLQELPESGMSELSAICKQAALEELFLTALKITK